MNWALDEKNYKIHPQKFALYSAFASIIMMFVALTSAYIVRQSAGNWLEFPLPNLFYSSTVVILLSSITLHASFINFKKRNTSMYRTFLVATYVLGLAFLVLQYLGWQAMTDMGVNFTLNPSGDFIYVISGIHAAHILGGIGAMTVALVHAFSLPHVPSPGRILRFELTAHYWHFVGLVWLYLLIFFIIQQ